MLHEQLQTELASDMQYSSHMIAQQPGSRSHTACAQLEQVESSAAPLMQ
jgi:hypothetical protein